MWCNVYCAHLKHYSRLCGVMLIVLISNIIAVCVCNVYCAHLKHYSRLCGVMFIVLISNIIAVCVV